MTAAKSFLNSTLIYTIGTFGSKILSFLLIPFFSYYLTKSDMGIYDISISIVSLCVPLISMQISNSSYRWLINTDEKDILIRKKIVTNSLFISFVGLAIYTIFYYLINLFLEIKYANYIYGLTISTSILPLFQYILRGFKLTKYFSIAGIINAFLILLLNIFFLVVFEFGIEGLFISTMIANIITIIFIMVIIKINKLIIFNRVDLDLSKKMLGYSLPLVPNTMSWWLINSADKFLILYFLSAEMNGIYAISTRFPTILMIINSIFLLSWQDYILEAKDNDQNFGNKLFDKFLNFQFGTILVLVSFSELVVYLMISKDYYESFKYMPFLYLGSLYSALAGYLSASYLKIKSTTKILTTSIISGIINLIICVLLLKYIGLYASAIGSFIGYLVMFILRFKSSKNILKLEINTNKIILLTILTIIFSGIIIYNNSYLNYLMILISIFMFYLLNKEIIIWLYKLISKKIAR